MFNFKQYDWRRYNFTFLVIMIILGICSAYFVSFAIAETMGSEYSGSYFRRQIISMIAGVVIAVIVSLIDYRRICDYVVIYYIVGTIMAAATRLTPWGTDLDTDSFRWLKFPGFNFQPSEICKIIIILALAVFFTSRKDEMDSLKTFFLGILIVMVPTGFILIQSDLSSSLVILFIFAIMIFAAGLSYKIVVPTVVISFLSIVGGVWMLTQPAVAKYVPLREYQIARIVGFLNPEKYALKEMYQQLKSIQAIGSGQLIGKLLSGESGRNYGNVDVCESDFIFSVIGEEVGFIGSCLIIGLLCVLIFLCIRAAKRCHDTMGYLIAIGISAMFMFQVFANVGVAACILPNTGLPLPFLSNGISSLMSSSIAVGMILNIGIQNTSGEGISFL